MLCWARQRQGGCCRHATQFAGGGVRVFTGATLGLKGLVLDSSRPNVEEAIAVGVGGSLSVTDVTVQKFRGSPSKGAVRLGASLDTTFSNTLFTDMPSGLYALFCSDNAVVRLREVSFAAHGSRMATSCGCATARHVWPYAMTSARPACAATEHSNTFVS